jgi:hypothetical protein
MVATGQGNGYSVVLFTRPFDTGDGYGDEILTKKINLEYCLAMYTLSPYINTANTEEEIHNFLYCFNPNIDLYMDAIALSLFLLSMVICV